MKVRVPLIDGGYCELDQADLFALVYELSDALGFVPFPPQALGLVDGVAWNAVARRSTAGFDVFLRRVPELGALASTSDFDVHLMAELTAVPDRLPDEIARLK